MLIVLSSLLMLSDHIFEVLKSLKEMFWSESKTPSPLPTHKQNKLDNGKVANEVGGVIQNV